MKIFITILCLCLTSSFAYIVDPGPKIKATVGGVWPKPKYSIETANSFILDPNNFQFHVAAHTCDILEKAIERYTEIIKSSISSPIRHKSSIYEYVALPRRIEKIVINLTSPCENQPHSIMDEWYYVSSSGSIIAHSIWGILRGMETYSQLIIPDNNGMLHIKDVRIRDSPRFAHRGLLLDTSRHFMSMSTIYKVLDGMEYNKLNVFHWHIVDDQAFPYESIEYPELSKKGAYMPSMVYSQADVADVIEYARLRGIRVIVEFDVPGHTRSWGNAYPEILVECGSPYIGKFGPINPINETSYKFLENLFNEVLKVFPDKYIHLGGDEVGFECWESNKEIASYVHNKGITFETLQKEFMEKVTRIVTGNSKAPIVWQEAMVKNVNMPEGTVVQVWLGNWRNLFEEFTRAGHRVLLSECWYLDHLATGGDWMKFYTCEPQDFNGSDEQMKLVMGGEACMWSEVVSDRNVISRIFPRVSATAERLWSMRSVTNATEAAERLEEHTCRMIQRGIAAQPPSGPGYC